MNEFTTVRPVSAPSVEEIDLRATGRTLWERRRLIALVASVGLAASVAVAAIQPSVYTAGATIMPIDVAANRLSPEATSGGVGALLSGAGIGRDGTISDKLVALLRSRSVTDAVLKKHHLLAAVIGQTPKAGEERAALNAAYRQLDRTLVAKPDPLSGLIFVNAAHPSPEVAASLANAFVAELAVFLNDNSLTSTRRKREFLEQKLQNVSRELGRMQADLVTFQEQYNLVSLETQTQSMVQSFMALKNQLMAKEMEADLQAKSVSSNDMELLGLRQEVARLKDSLQEMELGTSEGSLALKDLPRLSARMTRLQRDLATKQKVFDLLTEQLELAKIEEAKEALSFQVIDEAVPPAEPSQPNRPFVVLAGALISLFLGMLVALVAGKARRSPAEYAE